MIELARAVAHPPSPDESTGRKAPRLAAVRWAVTTHLPALAAVVLVVAAVVLGTVTLASRAPYEASALVVATATQVEPEQLPGFGEAVFSSVAVRDRAVAEGGLDMDPDDLIPGKVSFRSVPDTVLFEVTAVDGDAQRAALLADVTAAAFIEELNRPGDGVARFALQSPAPVPDRRSGSSPGGPAGTLAVGLVAGVAVALGAAWLLVLVLPPVTSAEQAADVAGTGVAGTVAVPRGAPDDLGRAGGLRLTARRLFPTHTGTVAFVTGAGGGRVASSVVSLLARLLEPRGRVTVSAPGDPPPPVGRPGEVHLVDAGVIGDRHDLPDTVPPGARFVLVVADGAMVGAVAAAARQFVPGELDGVVFVRRAGRRWRPWRGTTPATGRGPAAVAT